MRGIDITHSRRGVTLAPRPKKAVFMTFLLAWGGLFFVGVGVVIWWTDPVRGMKNAASGTSWAIALGLLSLAGVAWRRRRIPLVFETRGRVLYGDAVWCATGEVTAIELRRNEQSDSPHFELLLCRKNAKPRQLPWPHFVIIDSEVEGDELTTLLANTLGVPRTGHVVTNARDERDKAPPARR